MSEDVPVPVEMETEEDNRLIIKWSDGHRSVYSFQFLRGSCPCAECVDEITGKRSVFPHHIPPQVRPLEARPAGRYAYQIYFSDGHSTGLFTYDYLRRLCQCDQCIQGGEQQQ